MMLMNEIAWAVDDFLVVAMNKHDSVNNTLPASIVTACHVCFQDHVSAGPEKGVFVKMVAASTNSIADGDGRQATKYSDKAVIFKREVNILSQGSDGSTQRAPGLRLSATNQWCLQVKSTSPATHTPNNPFLIAQIHQKSSPFPPPPVQHGCFIPNWLTPRPT